MLWFHRHHLPSLSVLFSQDRVPPPLMRVESAFVLRSSGIRNLRSLRVAHSSVDVARALRDDVENVWPIVVEAAGYGENTLGNDTPGGMERGVRLQLQLPSPSPSPSPITITNHHHHHHHQSPMAEVSSQQQPRKLLAQVTRHPRRIQNSAAMRLVIHDDAVLVLQLQRALEKRTRRFEWPAIASAVRVDEDGAKKLGLFQ
jgi:hypothetical protein